MFKRTKGYLLLTLLVLTGLAGRLHSDTLSAKERITLLHELKATRNALLQATEGLSNRQLKYRPAPGQPSIAEELAHVAAAEEGIWMTASRALRSDAEATSSAVSGVPDAELEVLVRAGVPESLFSVTAKKSSSTALDRFGGSRTEMLRWLRTATINPRTRPVRTACGNFDAYQLMRMAAGTTARYTESILRIRQTAGFPRR